MDRHDFRQGTTAAATVVEQTPTAIVAELIQSTPGIAFKRADKESTLEKLFFTIRSTVFGRVFGTPATKLTVTISTTPFPPTTTTNATASARADQGTVVRPGQTAATGLSSPVAELGEPPICKPAAGAFRPPRTTWKIVTLKGTLCSGIILFARLLNPAEAALTVTASAGPWHNDTSSRAISPFEPGHIIAQPLETIFSIPKISSRIGSTFPQPLRNVTASSPSVSAINKTTVYPPNSTLAVYDYGALKPKNTTAKTGSYPTDRFKSSKYKTQGMVRIMTSVVTVYTVQSASLRKDIGSGENNESVVSTRPAGSAISLSTPKGSSEGYTIGTRLACPTSYRGGPGVSHNPKETLEHGTRPISSSHNLADRTIRSMTCTAITRNLSMDSVIDMTCHIGLFPDILNRTSPCHNSTNSSIATGTNPPGDPAESPNAPRTFMKRIDEATAIMYYVSKSIYYTIDSVVALRTAYETHRQYFHNAAIFLQEHLARFTQAVDRYGGAAMAIRAAYRRI